MEICMSDFSCFCFGLELRVASWLRSCFWLNFCSFCFGLESSCCCVSSMRIPVRQYRCNECGRFIQAAYPYYGAAFYMFCVSPLSCILTHYMYIGWWAYSFEEPLQCVSTSISFYVGYLGSAVFRFKPLLGHIPSLPCLSVTDWLLDVICVWVLS